MDVIVRNYMEGRRGEDYKASSQETGARKNEGAEVDCSNIDYLFP